MNSCIKCGKEIPEGELFCLECSLNPGASLFDELTPPARQPAPVGRMQTPQPVKPSAPQAPVAVRKKKNTGKRTGLIVALVLVSLMLAGLLTFVVWQYNDLRVERTRLATKEADILLREGEMEELEVQIATLQKQVETVQASLEQRDEEIGDLKRDLAESQGNQSQSEYDLTNALADMARIEEENEQLLLLEEELEENIKSLTEELEESRQTVIDLKASMKEYKTKADFMDKYVVFVENNNSKVYHTYDCEEFSRSNFWAYSRKLAESNGFGPCEVCGGKP